MLSVTMQLSVCAKKVEKAGKRRSVGKAVSGKRQSVGKALELLGFMEARGIIFPDIISYSAAISVCEKGGHWERRSRCWQP